MVNPNGIKTLLTNGLSVFPIKGNPVMVQKFYLKILLLVLFDATEILNNFILAEELLPKALQRFETCVLVNNNLCGKLFSTLESPVTFDQSFNVTSVSFFIPDFNLLCCELDNFTFKVLY